MTLSKDLLMGKAHGMAHESTALVTLTEIGEAIKQYRLRMENARTKYNDEIHASQSNLVLQLEQIVNVFDSAWLQVDDDDTDDDDTDDYD